MVQSWGSHVGVEKLVSSVTWTESWGRRVEGMGEKRVSSKALSDGLAIMNVD
jgi:hypothetical protein